VVQSLNRQINQALKSADILQRFEALDINPGEMLGEKEFSRFIEDQYGMWKDIVAKEGIRIDDIVK